MLLGYLLFGAILVNRPLRWILIPHDICKGSDLNHSCEWKSDTFLSSKVAARGLEMDIGTACMVSASNLVILPMLAPDLVDQPVQFICDTFFGARPVQRPVR